MISFVADDTVESGVGPNFRVAVRAIRETGIGIGSNPMTTR